MRVLHHHLIEGAPAQAMKLLDDPALLVVWRIEAWPVTFFEHLARDFWPDCKQSILRGSVS